MTDKQQEFEVVRSAADIPHFRSEEEECEFWQTHEMGEEMFRNPELPAGLPLPSRRDPAPNPARSRRA